MFRTDPQESRGLILATLGALVMTLPAPMKSSAQTNDTPRVQDSEEYSVYSATLSRSP